MTRKTQEWTERVGREAVALGMPWQIGMTELFTGLTVVDFSRNGAPLFAGDANEGFQRLENPLTDFRDRLTELAAVAWVEDVAREVYEERELSIEFGWEFGPVEYVKVYVWLGGEDMTGACRAPTLAEACIAAVRAMKGEAC